jgi:Zn-dependent protease
MLFSDTEPVQLIARVAALLIGLTVHEFAHAWTAYRLGDPTAKLMGRLTLNPISHIDPMGAMMMMLVGFGWAKPVPVDAYRVGYRGMLKVALAGPVSNIILAVFAALVLRAFVFVGGTVGLFAATLSDTLLTFLFIFINLNLMLAVFNMLPIPPLDGWKVMLGVVPADTAMDMHAYEPYGPMVLLVVLLSGSLTGFNVLGQLFEPVVDAFWMVFGAGLVG